MLEEETREKRWISVKPEAQLHGQSKIAGEV